MARGGGDLQFSHSVASWWEHGYPTIVPTFVVNMFVCITNSLFTDWRSEDGLTAFCCTASLYDVTMVTSVLSKYPKL